MHRSLTMIDAREALLMTPQSVNNEMRCPPVHHCSSFLVALLFIDPAAWRAWA